MTLTYVVQGVSPKSEQIEQFF